MHHDIQLAGLRFRVVHSLVLGLALDSVTWTSNNLYSNNLYRFRFIPQLNNWTWHYEEILKLAVCRHLILNLFQWIKPVEWLHPN